MSNHTRPCCPSHHTNRRINRTLTLVFRTSRTPTLFCSAPQPPDCVPIAGSGAANMEFSAKKSVSRTINVRIPRESRKRIDSENRESAEMLLDSYANFKRSGVPERVMWFDGEDWVDFEGEVLEQVRLGFGGGKVLVEVVIGGVRCLIDFMRMILVEIGSGKRRSAAWIDVAGKCFFPRSFVVDDDDDDDDDVDDKESKENEVENVRIGIDVRLIEDSNLGKRKRGVDNVEVREVRDAGEYSCGSESSSNCVVGGGKKLVKRALADTDAGVDRWPNCRLMRDGERGCEVLKSLFLAKVRTVDPGVEVRSVRSFVKTGAIARIRYLAFNRCVELTNVARGKANVVFAWYGMTAEGVGRIMAHGFGVPCDVKGSHGVGVHLRPISLPHLSAMQLEPDENGEKHAMLCRVVLGNIEEVEAGSTQWFPSSTKFDNGVDDLKSPRQYIVWGANMNTHILPECIVSFKSSRHVSAKTAGSAVVNSSNKVPISSVPLSILMSKLPDYLPSAKAHEIMEIHTAYKAGRMTKDDFVKGARAIASDRVLFLALSACHVTTNKR